MKASPPPADPHHPGNRSNCRGSLRSPALTGTALTCTALTCAAPAVLCRCGVRAACTVPHTVPVSYREALVCKCGGRAHRPDPAPAVWAGVSSGSASASVHQVQVALRDAREGGGGVARPPDHSEGPDEQLPTFVHGL